MKRLCAWCYGSPSVAMTCSDHAESATMGSSRGASGIVHRTEKQIGQTWILSQGADDASGDVAASSADSAASIAQSRRRSRASPRTVASAPPTTGTSWRLAYAAVKARSDLPDLRWLVTIVCRLRPGGDWWGTMNLPIVEAARIDWREDEGDSGGGEVLTGC